ncbi:MAG: phosphotransferase family protein [Granulosicoccus sp.]|nr:phosphotransferase family protein [Granulosicoccus sp.]
MQTDDDRQILDALANLPGYTDVPADSLRIRRLGGLTNRVYCVEQPSQESVVVRLAGEGTADYIDRNVELHNAHQAAAAGVSPDVLYANVQEGLMITRLVPGIETMTPALFAARAESVERAGRALKQLHASGVSFRFRFELFAMIEEYLGILQHKTIDLPDGYHDIVNRAEPLKAALAVRPVALTPCHCDPLCENFLDDGQRMWIVDWEYSGMNDPWWDLGDLSVEGSFSDEQDMQLLRAYCSGDPAEHEYNRMVIYKAMCDLLWTLWGLIQHADGNPAEDFWAYAAGRFDRCRSLMNTTGFERACQHL